MGHDTRLIENAEVYARDRGAVGVTLEMDSFQARPFYERLGYEVFGALEDCPRGHTSNSICASASQLRRDESRRTFLVQREKRYDSLLWVDTVAKVFFVRNRARLNRR